MRTFESEASSALGFDTGISPFDLKALLIYMSRDTKQIVYNDKASRSGPESCYNLYTYRTIDCQTRGSAKWIADYL